MGYLNNQVLTVDAILTKKGRELLAKNDGSFRITQFSLADDEIDYTLYNPTHPSGSAYYGEAIDNMPLLEAFPDESQIMKYKLATLPRGTAKLPVLDLGYSATVSDIRLFNTFNGVGINTDAANSANATSTTTLGTNVSATVIGTQINLRATTVNTLFGSNSAISTTITIVGLDSGARITIPVTITKTT